MAVALVETDDGVLAPPPDGEGCAPPAAGRAEVQRLDRRTVQPVTGEQVAQQVPFPRAVGRRCQMLQGAAAALAEMAAGRFAPVRSGLQQVQQPAAEPAGAGLGQRDGRTVARRGRRHMDGSARHGGHAVAAPAEGLDGHVGPESGHISAGRFGAIIGADQELPVAVRPRDRALGNPAHRPSRLRLQPGPHIMAHRLMDRRVAHHAALADLLPPGLELRLDQGDQPGAGRGKPQPGGQHGFEADEAGVADDGAGRVRDQVAVQMPGIGFFQHDHARIGAQFPGELAVADIDGIDPRCAMVEQDIGEAAGRGADIEADPPGRIDAETLDAVGQLQAAARNPGMVAPAHRQRAVVRHRGARLVDPPLAVEHRAGHDQRLGLAARVCHAAIHQQLVHALPRGSGSRFRHAPF